MHHVTMRCNNKEFLFDDDSRMLFLRLLDRYRAEFGIRLYNYCLLTNHIHLLFQVPHAETLSQFMQRLANVFARRFNVERGRKGHLWEGRFVSTIIQPSTCFLRCMSYIDMNPVRARIVNDPCRYQWCGHGELVSEEYRLLDPHTLYRVLGESSDARYQAYRSLLQAECETGAYSLADALFVGSPEFIRRLRAYFRGAMGSQSRQRRVALGHNIYALEWRNSGTGAGPEDVTDSDA